MPPVDAANQYNSVTGASFAAYSGVQHPNATYFDSDVTGDPNGLNLGILLVSPPGVQVIQGPGNFGPNDVVALQVTPQGMTNPVWIQVKGKRNLIAHEPKPTAFLLLGTLLTAILTGVLATLTTSRTSRAGRV